MENANASFEMKGQQESKLDEFWTLSGTKPFFSVIMAKSHLKHKYELKVPAKIQRLLPPLMVPVVLKYRGKDWSMMYKGSRKSFDVNWRNFAHDNDLKIGDACVFELEEFSGQKIVFRVQILKGEIPPELAKKIPGLSADSPITII